MEALISVLNPTPTFPAYTGPYQVGSTDIEIPTSSLLQTVRKPDDAPSTVAFRLYYPCEKPSTKSRAVRWISQPQHDQLASVWQFLGLGSSLSSWMAYALPPLTHVSLPTHRDASVASKTESSRWPVLVFSHGLGGSRNSYSYICGTLASYGIVVAAPDHRDGSQPISFVRKTEEEESRRVHYRIMKHQPCEETFRGRDGQLHIRIWEISALLEALTVVNDGSQELLDLHESSEGSASVLKQLQHNVDLKPGAVTFAGHSFGATTTIQLLKSVYYRQNYHTSSSLYTPITPTPAITSQITPQTPAIFLDPWGLPLISPAQSALRSQSLPAYQDPSIEPPYLTIMSQAFYDWRSNRDEILETLRSPSDFPAEYSNPLVFYPSTSAHLSQSDFGLLFPRLTKYFAKTGDPKALIDLNVRAILAMLRRRGVPVRPFDLEQAGAASKDDEEWVDLGEGEDSEHDAKILRRENEAVKGWKYVPLTERGSMQRKDGVSDEVAVEEASEEEQGSQGPVSTAKAFLVHGRKRSSVREKPDLRARVDSGTEEDLEGVIQSGKA